ncbi:hypothetical protein GCM10010840_20850 [Deinococcus aerolatus]|uniref:Uncharacterized protein n=1 Tax=Deinococcus aerolatus TaxID=522487 RepID=A0ABQ2GAP7_9DEIO|nr:hypothetical protein [Deinococcus aerolatus]GGL82903.1 hypothetical protein GCM10010840_20850 [Deinococcus aerolatus]
MRAQGGAGAGDGSVAGLDGLAALVLVGLRCSPQSLALLVEIKQCAPDFFTLLLPVLGHADVVRVARECLPTRGQLPPCDVSHTLTLLCACAHLQVSGGRLSRRWPACVGPAAAALPYWTVERVMGARLTAVATGVGTAARKRREQGERAAHFHGCRWRSPSTISGTCDGGYKSR